MTGPVTHASFTPERLDLFWRFLCERQTIWQRRCVERQLPPWTADIVLQQERFTNVYRELDPGTQYVILHILDMPAPREDKIFNVMLYRLIGRAESHAALGFQYLDGFDPAHLVHVLRHLRDIEGKPPFTAAYMVSAYSSLGTADKIDSVAHIFGALHRHFSALYARIMALQTAAGVYEEMRRVYGFGNFLAYQVLVDLLYPLRVYGGASLLPYTHDDWACAGPGARRGIGMLLHNGTQAADLDVMRWLRAHQRAEFDRLGLRFPFLTDGAGHQVDISLANMQNCLCEYHKYIKIREGTGRGRRKFRVPSVPAQLSFTAVLAEGAEL